MKATAPSFWVIFADALKLSAKQRGGLAYVPYWLIICTVLPVAAYHYGFDGKLNVTNDSNLIGALATVAVLSGFLGSVSVAAMAQIQQIACEYPFSDYLREEEVFDIYLFWPQLTLIIQLSSILMAGFSTYLVFIGILDAYRDELLLLNATFLIYVISKTLGLVELIRTLAWHKEQYTRLFAEIQAE